MSIPLEKYTNDHNAPYNANLYACSAWWLALVTNQLPQFGGCRRIFFIYSVIIKKILCPYMHKFFHGHKKQNSPRLQYLQEGISNFSNMDNKFKRIFSNSLIIIIAGENDYDWF
jgi:hypothetical protein